MVGTYPYSLHVKDLDPDFMSNIESLVMASVRFLSVFGKSTVGYYPQLASISEASSPSTANCISALYLFPNLFSREVLNNQIEELFQMQFGVQTAPSVRYSWCTYERSSIWATSKSLITILDSNSLAINDLRVYRSISWLLDQHNQHKDGWGWGYSRGTPSRPYYTYFVLQVLKRAILSSSQNKHLYLNGITKGISYLRSTRLCSGLWSNGSSVDPCPGNTLMAMAALLDIGKTLNRKEIDDSSIENGRSFLIDSFLDPSGWENIYWTEPGLAFDIQFFPPGKIEYINLVLGKNSILIPVMLNWLINHWIPFPLKNTTRYLSGGWLWPSTETNEPAPYTWTTALGLRSLSCVINGSDGHAASIQFKTIDKMQFQLFLSLANWKQLITNNTLLAVIAIVGVILTALGIFVTIW
jgi:hypothetical protein